MQQIPPPQPQIQQERNATKQYIRNKILYLAKSSLKLDIDQPSQFDAIKHIRDQINVLDDIDKKI